MRALLGLLVMLLAITPLSLGAQIVSGLTPPARRGAADSVSRTTLATERERRQERSRLDLRAWVDSAAEALARGEPVTNERLVREGDGVMVPVPVEPIPTLAVEDRRSEPRATPGGRDGGARDQAPRGARAAARVDTVWRPTPPDTVRLLPRDAGREGDRGEDGAVPGWFAMTVAGLLGLVAGYLAGRLRSGGEPPPGGTGALG